MSTLEDDSPSSIPLDVILTECDRKYKQLFQTFSKLCSNPGKEICMKYMRSGVCGNASGACRYDHPMERFGSDVVTSSALRVINLLGNVCSLCQNVSPEARGMLSAFMDDLVAVLDKNFEELTAEYGSGCIIYGDSVLKVHEAFKCFQKSIIQPKINKGKRSRKKREQASSMTVTDADKEFEGNSKISLQCLKYLNTRWADGENLFSSVLQCSLAHPMHPQLLPGLEQQMCQLADQAREQQDAHKERKERLRIFLLSIANKVINAHIRECPQLKDKPALLNSCVLKPFGSSANTLGLSSSDLDLCLGYDETALKVCLANTLSHRMS